MPNRKSDATNGGPEPEGKSVETPEVRHDLETPDVAAEPGSPDAPAEAPKAADLDAAAEALKEPVLSTPPADEHDEAPEHDPHAHRARDPRSPIPTEEPFGGHYKHSEAALTESRAMRGAPAHGPTPPEVHDPRSPIPTEEPFGCHYKHSEAALSESVSLGEQHGDDHAAGRARDPRSSIPTEEPFGGHYKHSEAALTEGRAMSSAPAHGPTPPAVHDPRSPIPTEEPFGGHYKHSEAALSESVSLGEQHGDDHAAGRARDPRSSVPTEEPFGGHYQHSEAAIAQSTATPRASEPSPAAAVTSETPARAATPPAPEPTRPQQPPVDDSLEDEDSGGWSFAARALTGLLLLLAGGGLALWGAPKVAPMLPAGMKPVADFIAPAAHDTEARIATLEGSVGDRISAVEGRLQSIGSDTETRTSAAVNDAASRLQGEIDALKATVSQADTSTIAEQVARLQSAVDGHVAELETLKQQLAGAAPSATGGQASQDAADRIDVYRAELDGLRTEVGQLQSQVAGFGDRVDQAVSNANQEIETARTRVEEIDTTATTQISAAETASNLAAIDAAVASGEPFEGQLKALEEAGASVPADLTAVATDGVATMASLRDTFPDAAHAAIRASIMAGAGDNVLARSRAFLETQIASRSLTPEAGNSPDAVLSRAEDALRRDDLGAAVTEIEALPSEGQAAMADWLDAAKKRVAALTELQSLQAAPPAPSN